ncbi:MAG: hypothetical protein QXT43_01590 [Candidatus Micrarchaeaceae archaeon]
MFGIGKLFGKKGRAAEITSININYMGEVHQLNGLKLAQKEFEVKVPIHNKTASNLDVVGIKKPELRIDVVSAKAPFELVSVAPQLPITVPYMKSAELVIRLRAPDVSYTGPLYLIMQANTPDAVHIGISNIILHSAGKSYPIEDSARSFYVSKGDPIKQDVQLLSILHEGEEVKAVKANAPFSVLKTEPQTPFKITNKNSFIISMYLKPPDYNYAGPLEITFE